MDDRERWVQFFLFAMKDDDLGPGVDGDTIDLNIAASAEYADKMLAEYHKRFVQDANGSPYRAS